MSFTFATTRVGTPHILGSTYATHAIHTTHAAHFTTTLRILRILHIPHILCIQTFYTFYTYYFNAPLNPALNTIYTISLHRHCTLCTLHMLNLLLITNPILPQTHKDVWTYTSSIKKVSILKQSQPLTIEACIFFTPLTNLPYKASSLFCFKLRLANSKLNKNTQHAREKRDYMYHLWSQIKYPLPRTQLHTDKDILWT